MAGARSIGVVVMAVALVRAPGAMAQGEGTEARAAFEQARRAYNVGRWQEAAEGFERAYRLSGDPVLLFDHAQALRRAGRLEAALAGYRAYLRERPDAANRSTVEAQIAELERSVRARE